jgi:hypothetical protein
MKIDFDVDIDCANRDRVLKHMRHIPASVGRDGKLTKHNTGVYFQNIPTDPLAGYSEIDHKVAESQGYFKVDFLNNYIYKDVKDIAHLDELVEHEPMWELLEHEEVVTQLYHLNRHYDIVKDYKPTSVMEVAMILAIIRPAKRHLIGQSFEKIAETVWQKPTNEDYHFKKAHAVAFALAICVQLNLLVETLNETI